jgi:hypothetical protein
VLHGTSEGGWEYTIGYDWEYNFEHTGDLAIYYIYLFGFNLAECMVRFTIKHT